MPAGFASVLRNRVAICREADVPNGRGGFDTSWTVSAPIAAQVTSIGGAEKLVEAGTQASRRYRIRIRWRADLGPGQQLRYGTETLDVVSADDPDGRREQLVIVADTAAALPVET